MNAAQKKPQESADHSPKTLRERLEENVDTIATDWTDFGATLIKTGIVGLYLTALLFVTGWAYADRYFDLFGISMSGLDRDVPEVFYIYALWTFRDFGLFLLLLAATLAIMAFLLALFSHGNLLLRWFAIVVIAVFVVASFAGAFRLGQWRAEAQVPNLISRDYFTFPRVIVSAKPDSATAAFLKTKNAGESTDCLRKLFMDKKNIYLYAGYESTKDSIPAVFIVPLADIAGIEIIKNRGLCQD